MNVTPWKHDGLLIKYLGRLLAVCFFLEVRVVVTRSEKLGRGHTPIVQ